MYIQPMSDKTTAFNIRIKKEDHKRYKLYAVTHETTFKEIFVEEMERRIAEAEKAPKEQEKIK
ncbi:hypothetical protein D0S45_17320 [Marinifilum sp. JC120]|nr:hypothetical protein D0S45_17320 [Marinifilum sp. JC120]